MKGRPPLEPRIKELEQQQETVRLMIQDLANRVAAIERIMASQQIADGKQNTYQPLFNVWPSNSTGTKY